MSIEKRYQEMVQKDTKTFLDWMNQMFPFDSPDGNLQVSILDKKTGKASRWKSWWEVRENEWWLSQINQRLIAVPEIVFDIDPEEQESEELFQERIRKTVQQLHNDGIDILNVYNTGSRGIHTHSLFPDLIKKRRESQRRIKSYFLNKYKADTMKSTPRAMIALEGKPHWKTGKLKEGMRW